MASARIYLTDNIYIPGGSSGPVADFYIDPRMVTYTNGSSNVSEATGWRRSTSEYVDTYDKNRRWRYKHVYYTPAVPADGWSEPLGTLTFRFPNAAVRLSDGRKYTLKVDFITCWAYNGDDSGSDRDISIVALDDNDSPDSECRGFWIQSLVIGNGPGNNAAAVSVTVRFSIVNDSGTTQSGTFFYPLTDIDATLDATNKNLPPYGPGNPSPYDPCQRYSEGIEILSNCTRIYAGQPSDLILWHGPGCTTSNLVNNISSGTSFDYTTNVAGSGLWFQSSLQGPARSVSIAALFTSGAQIQWRGSNCGTLIQGENMLTTIEYDGNAPAEQLSNVPGNQYKARGHSITLSSQVPTRTVSGVRYIFKGWSKTQSGSVAYQPGGTFTEDNVNGSIKLYAIWEPAYLITLNLQGGYAWINNKWDSTSPIGDWVPGGSSYTPGYTLQRLGYTFGGWSTAAGGSAYPFPVQNVTGPMTFYAIWTKKTYTVTFRDGYTSTASNPDADVLKRVTVSYGGSVSSTEVPVPGQTYSGRVFKKPGMYSFEGWAGSWTNVTSDRDVIALWEFTPIWVIRNGKWVKYRPVEP